MFTISGRSDGATIDVTWDDGVLIADDDAFADRVHGRVGGTVTLRPTGPTFVVDLADGYVAMLTILDELDRADDDGNPPFLTGDAPQAPVEVDVPAGAVA